MLYSKVWIQNAQLLLIFYMYNAHNFDNKVVCKNSFSSSYSKNIKRLASVILEDLASHSDILKKNYPEIFYICLNNPNQNNIKFSLQNKKINCCCCFTLLNFFKSLSSISNHPADNPKQSPSTVSMAFCHGLHRSRKSL